MDERIPHSFGSAVTLGGAFCIGWALHVSVVTGNAAVTDPAPVLVTGFGLLLIALGRRMEREFDPSEYTLSDETAEEDDEEAFDEELSPLDGEAFEGLERDEEYDG